LGSLNGHPFFEGAQTLHMDGNFEGFLRKIVPCLGWYWVGNTITLAFLDGFDWGGDKKWWNLW